jgi:hypothetical protein
MKKSIFSPRTSILKLTKKKKKKKINKFIDIFKFIFLNFLFFTL